MTVIKRSLAVAVAVYTSAGPGVFCNGLPIPKSTGEIELVRISPPAGSVVDQSTVISADLTYAINNYQDKKHRYFISIVFVSSASSMQVFMDDRDGVGKEEISRPSGSVSLTYPLERVWNGKLAKPVRVYFYLHERFKRTASIVLERTPEIVYQVAR